MQTVNLRLDSINDVKRFVQAVSLCDFEVDLQSGRYIVDAKSIMGIFSLDLANPVIAHIYDDNCELFLKEIEDFIIAE